MRTLVFLSLAVILLTVKSHAQCPQSDEINKVTVKVDKNVVTEVSSDNSTINLYLDYNWTVSNVPANFSLDGFIIKMNDDKRNPILPIGNCHSSGLIWITTVNASVCDTSVTTTCADLNAQECLCSRTSGCTASNNGRCFDIWAQLNFGSPFTLPITTTKVRFPIKFGRPFLLDMRPYYRESVRQGAVYTDQHEAINSCPSALMKKSYSWKEAENICCKAGIRTTVADNITLTNFSIDVETNTLNATLLWLSPNELPITKYEVYIILTNGYSRNLPYGEEAMMYNLSEPHDLTSCNFTHRHYFAATVHDLSPNTSYTIGIRNEFNSAASCSFCSVDTDYKTKDLCGYVCHREAICTKTSQTKITCRCKNGYHGDGYTTATNASATGCWVVQTTVPTGSVTEGGSVIPMTNGTGNTTNYNQGGSALVIRHQLCLILASIFIAVCISLIY